MDFVIAEKIKEELEKALSALGIDAPEVFLEHPTELENGDYSTNVALILGQKTGKNPLDIAEEISNELLKSKVPEVEKIEVAGPGFINFFLSPEFFAKSVAEIAASGDNFGKNEALKNKKVMVEYTDPNPFKEFHIGHLMSNAIGEAISRVIEFSGAETKRANYQGDVGVHVAKAIWGKMHKSQAPWGEAYALGAREYDSHKEEIDGLNKKIYERNDKEVNALYDQGRKFSLEAFEKMYKKLGTKFDSYFFESDAGNIGRKIVEENRQIFEESEGAVVFRGEKYGLHTRVFINSMELPTYEAKELALAKIKYDKFPYDTSIVITANEQDAHFEVGLKAMEFIFPELAEKTRHISHGMLRFPTGKMSSRTGDVITAESLIEDVKKVVLEKMESPDEKVAEQVAVGAIKYAILRQAIGHDIIFDFDKSLSFEGDSGPYLQYSCVRAQSVLEKAKSEKISAWRPGYEVDEISEVERILYQFPEIVEKALLEYAPHRIVTYLTALAGAFNTYYAERRIVDASDDKSPYRVFLARAVSVVLKNGLWILGMSAPEKM